MGVDHLGQGRWDQVRDRLGRNVRRIPEEVHHRSHGAIRLLVGRLDAHLLCDAGLCRPCLFGHPGGDGDDCDDEHRLFSYHLDHCAMVGRCCLGRLLELVLAWPDLGPAVAPSRYPGHSGRYYQIYLRPSSDQFSSRHAQRSGGAHRRDAYRHGRHLDSCDVWSLVRRRLYCSGPDCCGPCCRDHGPGGCGLDLCLGPCPCCCDLGRSHPGEMIYPVPW
mmetsp:Transcript_1170/g.3339  ORF Transcript_1170/g.3339 Transcript_1170/m.3339 type:complete len:219 (-) Transcript_1170:1694-2350(-)